MEMNIQQILLVVVFLFRLCKPYSFQIRTITLDGFSQCAQDEKNTIRFSGTVDKIARNKYAVNGEFIIKGIVRGPIEVREKFIYTFLKCHFAIII